MVQILSGNVLLKPAQKRRILSHLKRTTKLGEHVGDFNLTVSLARSGKHVEARAKVADKKGAFEVHSRDAHWETAVDGVIKQVHSKVHAQRIGLA
jgi:ribosome-associated translation inhibitor RaiA